MLFIEVVESLRTPSLFSRVEHGQAEWGACLPRSSHFQEQPQGLSLSGCQSYSCTRDMRTDSSSRRDGRDPFVFQEANRPFLVTGIPG
jgi:hypothetical protein